VKYIIVYKQYRLNVRTFIFYFLHKAITLVFDNLGIGWQSISKFICIKSSAFMSSVENVLHIGWSCRNISTFRFLKIKLSKATRYLFINKFIQGRFIVPEWTWPERGTFYLIPGLSRAWSHYSNCCIVSSGKGDTSATISAIVVGAL